MYRIAMVAFLIFFACKNDDAGEQPEEGAFNYTRFSGRFPAGKVPYTLSDTAILNHKDTSAIRGRFPGFIPDSLLRRVFGDIKVIYTPIAKLEKEDAETFYIVHARSGAKKAALLVIFDKDNQYASAFPFLLPDADPATTQQSTIDKAFSISRGVSRRISNDMNKEGKDVYAYNAETRSFSLVMTDILDDRNLEVINPIDTFPRTHALAGDYTRGKRNLVSVRDGRSPSLLNFFIHMENEEGDCTGELKGSAILISSKTAAYRQGGDPCVLEFTFSGSTVTVKEIEGCGARRGLDCTFNGSFTKKKPAKAAAKTSAAKPKKRP